MYYIITIQLVRESLKPTKRAANGQTEVIYKKMGIIYISQHLQLHKYTV